MSLRTLLPPTLFTALLCASLPPCAAALNCVSEQGQNLPLNARSAGPLKISASLPVGREVFRQRYPLSVWCSISSPQPQAENLWLHRRTSSTALGNGLTLFTTLNGERSSEPGSVDSGLRVDNHAAADGQPSQHWQRLTFSVEVSIVKTAETPPAAARAALVSPQIPLLELGSQQGGQRVTLLLQGADRWLTFVAQSCRVRGNASMTVSLGGVSLRGTRGVGATSSDKLFQLNLLCDREVAGSVDVMLQLDGESPAGVSGAGLVALSAQPLAAQGVALQILHGEGRTPLTLGQAWQIARYPLTEGGISVPLIARYYQYATHVKAGKADATLTWTLSYR